MKSQLICAALLAASAVADAGVDVVSRPAEPAIYGSHSVMLDVARAGNRLVAVGERGIVLVSDDSGINWKQSPVPTSVSLVKLAFATSDLGWAVGHFGTVLHTQDGGKTWERQLGGVQAAKLALQYFEDLSQKGGGDPQALAKQVADAKQLVDDGPDKPFLDVFFDTPQHGFIVGAYNLIFSTSDGGKSWVPWQDHVDNPRGLHLYAIHQIGTDWYIAGEQGLLLKSVDGGQSFRALKSPYDGSFFGVTPGSASDVLAFGLRGNVFRSTDNGQTWTPARTTISPTWNAGSLLNGAVYLGGQDGQLDRLGREGDVDHLVKTASAAPITGIAAAPDGALVLSRMGGMDRIPLNQ
ncbi:MAG: hypothetical protein JWR07_1777 [Nevskia sp.]|nr:hypothetical protein [Nevskia sp.]